MNPSEWIPMRWPATWQDPEALDRLRGTPVNCLVVPSPADQRLGPLLKRAGKEGLAVVSLSNLPASVLCLSNASWPRVRTPGAGKGDAPAGPTEIPWVDSNGWLIRLSQALAPGKPVWVAFDPPNGTALSPNSYALAVADAEAYGGRWVISIDTLDALQPVAHALAFFERHKEWRSYRPFAVLGVVSDFSGPNEFTGGESLNLLARRHQPYRVIQKSRVSQAELAGLKAVLYVDQYPPGPAITRTLLAFAAAGGLLIVPPNWSVPDGAAPSGDTHPRYHIRGLAGGRVAIAKNEVSDPYLLAADSQILMSHRNDLVRVWNAASTNSYYLRSPDGEKALIELINYTARTGGDPISVRVVEPYRRARLLTLERNHETWLRPVTAHGGTELHLPPFSVYAAIELHK